MPGLLKQKQHGEKERGKMIRKRRKTHKTYKSNERIQSSTGWGYAISICPALLADKHSLQQQGLVQGRVVKSPRSASACPTLLGSRAALQDHPGSYKPHSKALCTPRAEQGSPLPLGNGAAILLEGVARSRQENLSAATARLLLMALMGHTK